jgi:hypothetical protein
MVFLGEELCQTRTGFDRTLDCQELISVFRKILIISAHVMRNVITPLIESHAATNP